MSGHVTAFTGTYLIAVTGNFGTTARLDPRQTSDIHSTWAPVLVVPAVFCCPGKVYEPRPSGEVAEPHQPVLPWAASPRACGSTSWASPQIARDFPFGL